MSRRCEHDDATVTVLDLINTNPKAELVYQPRRSALNRLKCNTPHNATWWLVRDTEYDGPSAFVCQCGAILHELVEL